MLVGRPVQRPGFPVVLLSLLFFLASAAALLPAGDWLPEWRARAPEGLELGRLFAAMPAHTVFWWGVLAGTVIGAWFLLASPLDTMQLRVFLHCVAGVVAAYAVVSIVQTQTGWSFAYSGGANFGLLPNRNHTATLLVVGAVISFGLMQWELARTHRFGAAMAAIWGAPALAALLFFSTSRAGVLFLALGIAIWAVGASGQAVARRTALIAGAILAVFLGVLFIVGGSTVRDRLVALWQDAVVAGGETSGSRAAIDFRQPVFGDALKMIEDAPLTGQGMGHFEFVFPHYREASRAAARVLHPESDWLMVAAESGIPACGVLVILAGWYFVRAWRGRQQSGGLLRWTAASAVGAALAHGAIDVPWHRPALGWFLLLVAAVSLPAGRHVLRWPAVWRAAQVVFALILLGAGGYAGWALSKDRPPVVFRWEAYASDMKRLLAAGRYDEGDVFATEVIRAFPLSHQAYYWRAGFLRMFANTEKEMERDLVAGRYVEPVLPWAAAQQAQLWQGIDEKREAVVRLEGMRRAALIEKQTGSRGLVTAELERGLRAAEGRPSLQAALKDLLRDDPVLLAEWARMAQAELVDDFLAGMSGQESVWLDGLAPQVRDQVLNRWVSLPSAAGAVAYMEARNSPAPGPYWRQLSNVYAKAGDKERAVRVVAEAEGISLQGRPAGGDFGGQLASLEGQGNEVAVRRLLKEAVESKTPDSDQLSVCLAWYAAAGDWESAWKAASRLVTTSKKGQ
jgi:O-antigen ligase